MNKHQSRTKETRELLLRSAEQIFVRDGYAGADLGEIAALAGRTKGAIYAQFKSKEDIFMALVEEHALRYRAEMEEALATATSTAENRQVFRHFCLKMVKDTAWNLLMLEFKMFAIRNPAALSRFQQFMSTMISPDDETRLSRVFGTAGAGQQALSRSLSVQAMQPLLSALTLELLFDPAIFTEEVLAQITGKVFDAIVAVADDGDAAKASKKPNQPKTTAHRLHHEEDAEALMKA